MCPFRPRLSALPDVREAVRPGTASQARPGRRCSGNESLASLSFQAEVDDGVVVWKKRKKAGPEVRGAVSPREA